MKTKRILLIFMVLLNLNLFSQENNTFKPIGKVTGKVFWNYTYDMTEGNDKESGFNLRRAYLGYKYKYNEQFSSEITLDASHTGDAYSVFIKKALLNWSLSSKVKISLGVIGLEHFSDQESFFGYRYVMKSFNDKYRFSPSADLGVKVKYNINKKLSSTLFIVNGEGNKSLQDEDGRQKYGANLVYKHKDFIAKMYYDYTSVAVDGADVDITTFSAFVGYKFTSKLKLGAEFNKLFNAERSMKVYDGKNRSGFSFYSTYILNPEFEFFGRLDIIDSNIVDGNGESWNVDNDGENILLGCQYTPITGVKMALNYKTFLSNNSNIEDVKRIFMNFEFKF